MKCTMPDHASENTAPRDSLGVAKRVSLLDRRRRLSMSKTQEETPKKKGFFATLKESMTKTSEGCGPGCGCHVEVKKDDKAETDETTQKKDTSK